MNILNSETKLEPIDAIRPHPRNPREGDVGAIHESIEANGFYGSILAQKSTGFILAGNHRHQAAMQQGAEQIPVTWVDVDDDHALRILLADNRTNDVASYNEDELANILQELAHNTGTLAGTGYDGDALDELLEDLGREPQTTEGLTDPDEAPEPPADPITKPGDLWVLGNHRLLCGDSTKAEDVERLMDGEKADMVFTDPPYGMSLDTNYSQMHKSNDFGGGGKDYKAIAGDNTDFTNELITTVFAMFPYCKEVFLWGADYYRKLIPNGGSWIVWDKRANDKNMNLDKLLGSSFELCWSLQQHKRDIARILWSGHHGMQSCDTKQRVHPTQKPVELVEWFFERWGNVNDIVADIYGGSGSTLIACEKTARHCRMMELDPAYCDVIVKRWEDYTGQKAHRENA